MNFPGDPYAPRRRVTREVRVGDVALGATHPIRVQSMTTTDTQDVAATADQAERLAGVGCEIVRITAPSLRDAEALREIRAELDRRGVRVPLVADIHFTPNAAMLAAEAVEKVRVNPGNFADKKKFEIREYSDRQYEEEIERVAGRFRPLVLRCKELGRALRIGTNHGSLSDRVMNRYGDTPEGMVQSALEFLDVCEAEGYRDLVFSMKSSNPRVAVQAYRLLALRLEERAPGQPSYPFHVGVTEAGDAEDGRVKSAIGIGALLLDGLGDTIRVSLTEDPEREVPVARTLAEQTHARWERAALLPPEPAAPLYIADPIETRRRMSAAQTNGPIEWGGDHPVRVELDLGEIPDDPEGDAWRLGDTAAAAPDLPCEGVRVALSAPADFPRLERFAEALGRQPLEAPLILQMPAGLATHVKALSPKPLRWVIPVAEESDADLASAAAAAADAGAGLEWQLAGPPTVMEEQLARALRALPTSGAPPVAFSVRSDTPVPSQRRLIAALGAQRCAAPVALLAGHDDGGEDAALLSAATELGALLCDGIGDAVAVRLDTHGGGDPAKAIDLAYRILQGARLRTTRTEFISCPSCGRTLFDLQETTARIKSKTDHLKGVKIAIMGCIVNGPGEMADADFGYVGSGPGVVNLYVGQDCVERRVPSGEADQRLVDLIRAHGRWVDPS